MQLRDDMPIDQSIDQLRQLAKRCRTLHVRGGLNHDDDWSVYVKWADDCEKALRKIFPDPSVIHSVHTPRYWQIVTQNVTHLKELVIEAEREVQAANLDALATALGGYLQLRERPGDLAVVDTCALINYQRIDQIRWRQLVPGSGPLRVVIPHLVLDELDDKRYLGSDKVKDRARSAITPLEERQETLERDGYADLIDAATTVEYLLDPPGHQRRTNPDEEILERARFLHHVTGRQVALITGDYGMRVRCTAAYKGLRAVPMPASHARDQSRGANAAASTATP